MMMISLFIDQSFSWMPKTLTYLISRVLNVSKFWGKSWCLPLKLLRSSQYCQAVRFWCHPTRWPLVCTTLRNILRHFLLFLFLKTNYKCHFSTKTPWNKSRKAAVSEFPVAFAMGKSRTNNYRRSSPLQGWIKIDQGQQTHLQARRKPHVHRRRRTDISPYNRGH